MKSRMSRSAFELPRPSCSRRDGAAADGGAARAVGPLILRRYRPAAERGHHGGAARKTHIPITTGERIFTKWGFKEILEKRAPTILQPDVC